MKIVFLLLVLAVAFASCSTTKYGCPGVNYVGAPYKATAVTLQ